MAKGRSDAQGLERRRILQLGVATMVGLAGGAGRVWAAIASGAAPVRALPAPARAFLDAYCDALIPANDTGGALAADVPAFTVFVWAASLSEADFSQAAVQLSAISAELDRRAGAPFSSLATDGRVRVLGPLDQEVMASAPAATTPAPYAALYRRLKATVVFGYYTSEIGGSQELRYELVPGRYDPDIPVDPRARPFSNG